MARRDEIRHRVSLWRDFAPVFGTGDDNSVLGCGKVPVGPDLAEVADGQVQTILDLGGGLEESPGVEPILDFETLVFVLHEQGVCREIRVCGAPCERGAVDRRLVGGGVVHQPQTILMSSVDLQDVLLGLLINPKTFKHGL